MSDRLQKKYGPKLPWVFGKSIRIPRIKFEITSDSSLKLPVPSQNLVLILIYIALFWLVCGGVYLVLQSKNGTLQEVGMYKDRIVWVAWKIQNAYLIESITAGFLIYIGGVGILLIYRSQYHQFNYNYAIKLYLIGICMLVFTFCVLSVMIFLKTDPNRFDS